jgi:hypothetical protein
MGFTMKNIIPIILLTVIPLSQSQEIQAQTDSSSAHNIKTSYLPLNSLNINPAGIFLGSVGATYEHLFAERHGATIDGSYGFGKGYGLSVSYRYHYSIEDSSNILISPFWGPFIHGGKVSTSFKDNDQNYDVDIELITVGLNLGARSRLWEKFNFVWRIGWGYPVSARFSWSPQKSEDYKTIETLTKILGGIDAELSIGFVF